VMVAGADSDITLINSDNATEGIVITYDEGDDTIENNQKKYKLSIEIHCVDNITYEETSNSYNEGAIKIIANSKYACPFATTEVLSDILDTLKYVFAGISFALGFVFNFFGLKYIKLTAFLIGFVIFFIIIVVLLGFVKLKEGYEESDVYFVLIAATIGGILGGAVISFLEKLVTFLAGFGIGILLAVTFELFILGTINSDNKYLFWAIAFFAGLIVGAVALAFHDWIIIIMTTLYGSWLICTSGLLVIYSEYLSDYVEDSDDEDSDSNKGTLILVLYIALFIIITVVGFFV